MKRFLPIVTVFLPVAFLYLVGGLEFLERIWMDAQFRMVNRGAASDIVLVDIDPKSLRALEVWPWPRGYHATVIENLVDAGAKRVGVDVDFSSRSVTDGDQDQELARVLAATRGKVVLPVFQQWQDAGQEMSQLTAVEPLPEFRRHAILGSINVQPDSDGLTRRYHNRTHFTTRLVPAFAAAMAGEPRPDLDAYYIDFSIASRTIPRISFVDVLTGRFDPSVVRNRAVIIGPTAVELGDQVAVPIDASLPGPLLQALAYESLTQDRTLERLGPMSTLLIALVLTLFLGPLFDTASWQRGLLLMLGFSAGALLLGAMVQRVEPVIVDVIPWLFTLAGLFGYSLVTRIDQQAVGLANQDHMIRQTEVLMHHVVQNSFDSIVTVGEDGVIETFNRAAQKMFGLKEDAAIGRKLVDLVHPASGEGKESLFAKATEAPVEAIGTSRRGRRFPVELVVTAIDTTSEPKLVAVLRDITERSAHQDQLKHQATHDPLTDLPNRSLLRERVAIALSSALEERQTVAVLLLDLDRFKEINDALGHRTGDLLLKEVAKRLQEPLAPNDTLARLGGDEFAVLLPATTLEKVLQTAWKLIESLRTSFAVEGLSLQVDTSLGITLYPDHGHDAETLIQRADVAMYVAKRKRAGLAVYRPEQDFNHMRLLTLRGDLRHAIDNEHLTLAYQPKISASSDRIMGVEALVRWSHPEHGNIPPDEFIGLAEHSGLIGPLTRFVLKTAMQQAALWRGQGLQLNVSVNLSARNLLEEGLPKTVERLLATHQMLPEFLTLEITESVIMEDPERALKIVTRLEELGVSISVDDFGTGYSSLGYLMRLPAKELKIDKSFVMQMEHDAGSATIVHSTIELAHNLGLKVVAEGVESEAIWDVLKELGCDIGQGFFFSKPVPAARLPHTIRNLESRCKPELVAAATTTGETLDAEVELTTRS